MARVPDEAFDNISVVGHAAFILYAYYCKKRNKESGGWKCPNTKTAEKVLYSRSRISELRKLLREKGWIQEGENDFITPILGFGTVEPSTLTVEPSTLTVEPSTLTVEPSTPHDKEVPVPLPVPLPVHLPEEERQPRARAPDEGIPDVSKHWAVVMYETRFRHQPTINGQELIFEAVTDPEVWQNVLDIWKGNDHQQRMVGNLVDRYKREVKRLEESGVNQNGRPTNRETAGERDLRTRLETERLLRGKPN